jgi:hypothetical protein
MRNPKQLLHDWLEKQCVCHARILHLHKRRPTFLEALNFKMANRLEQLTRTKHH